MQLDVKPCMKETTVNGVDHLEGRKAQKDGMSE